MQIRVHNLLERTKMAGPGWRFCLWVQGCSRHCEGCMATATWDFKSGISMDIQNIFEQVASTSDIEGITFLGGEPFEQAKAVAALAIKVKSTGLSVVTFTGFTYKELLENNSPHIKDLLAATDLLIDGSFIQKRFDLSRPWVGSDNQQYHFLSNHYDKNTLYGVQNQIEVRINTDGSTFINGMGDFSKIKNLL